MMFKAKMTFYRKHLSARITGLLNLLDAMQRWREWGISPPLPSLNSQAHDSVSCVGGGKENHLTIITSVTAEGSAQNSHRGLGAWSPPAEHKVP